VREKRRANLIKKKKGRTASKRLLKKKAHGRKSAHKRNYGQVRWRTGPPCLWKGGQKRGFVVQDSPEAQDTMPQKAKEEIQEDLMMGQKYDVKTPPYQRNQLKGGHYQEPKAMTAKLGGEHKTHEGDNVCGRKPKPNQVEGSSSRGKNWPLE